MNHSTSGQYHPARPLNPTHETPRKLPTIGATTTGQIHEVGLIACYVPAHAIAQPLGVLAHRVRTVRERQPDIQK
jgi:hypothetical protein